MPKKFILNISVALLGYFFLMSIANAACTKNDLLKSGEHLLPGQAVCSTSKTHMLACQADGNMVFYINGKPGFRTNTNGQSIKGCYMQKDGNLVVYHTNGQSLWNSGTHSDPGAYLSIRDDFNIVAIWDKNHIPIRIYSKECNSRLNSGEVLMPGQSICSPNNQHILACQADGNMVLYHSGVAGFRTNTNGQLVKGCYMQKDGNLVVYHTNGQPLWNSGTQNNPYAYLTVSDDGILMLRERSDRQIKVYK